MAKGNRTLIEKADIAISDLTGSGGYLESIQAKDFIKVAIKQSNLLKECTVRPMMGPKLLLETIRFGSRIMHAGTVGEALAEAKRTKPDLGKAELDTKLFKAEVRLPYDVLEDNIERDRLKSTVMQMLPEACGRDLEEFVLMSDTSSTDIDLKQFDGLFVQATTNTVNQGAAYVSKTMFSNMVLSMPAEFKANKPELRLFVSTNTEDRYADLLADRATGYGDIRLTKDGRIPYRGIPIVPLALISEAASSTQALLCHPKNIHVGIEVKKIQILVDEDISAGDVIIVARMRIDAKYAYEPAVVRAYNILV